MKKLLIILLSIMSLSIMAQVNQVWDQISNFISNGRHHPITFSNDNYGFVISGSYLDDVYKYDKLNDTWSQLQNIPFNGRGYAYGVSSGNKAYMGFGSNSSGSYPTDWWEYDMDNDIWNQKASFPGSGRKHPAMVVVNNKIYMGCGNNNNGNLGDWWEYDIGNDLWAQKTDFPGIERHHPYYFNINNFAYVGFGHSNTGILKDFYQYDPSNDTWTQVNDFPGEARVAGTQFSYNEKGYILSGDGDDHGPLDSGEFWEYEYLDDSWTQLTSHPEGARWAPGSFVIDCYVYFLLGYNHATNSFPLTIYKYKLSEDCGCTDPLALNYDSLATIDDGSCIALVFGCTDSLALNYDSLTNVDDGTCCGLQLNWEQLGQDINGESSIDASGRAISYNRAGNIVAIGARWNDDNGNDAGHVRVYEYDGFSWNKLGSDIDGEYANDRSGHSLSINGTGDIVAIGAYGNDDNGTDAGHVRVYEYDGSSWNQLGNDIDGENANDFKGFKVDINEIGDKIVVGSYGNDDNGTNAGKTQVYYFDGISWNQLGDNIYGENINDVSSKSLQINDLGDIIAIGAPNNATNGTNSGQVRVFEFLNTDSSWVQIGQDINGENNGDFSGGAISLSDLGDIIAVGAKRNDGNGSNSGHVRVFEYSSNMWNQIGQDINGEYPGDESGYSVSLNGLGNKIAIGSYLNSNYDTESGHVRVFYFDANSWDQLGNDIDGEFANDWSGRSVALNNFGDRLAIGADLNDGNGAHSGHVRVFSYNISCLEGCTDPTAFNYDSLAIVDNGSCIILGCTGPTYCNYNPTATMDDGSCWGWAGCTDPIAINYNSIANCDDSSCTYALLCDASPITGLFISDIIDDRVTANFDNMNIYDASGNQICRVDQLRIKYREIGTNSWSQKNIGSPTGYDPVTGVCNSTQKTNKIIYNLSPATTYEWQMRVWYCDVGVTSWVNGPDFTTAGECPNVGNFTAYGANPTKATFNWQPSNGVYEFVRIKMRIDSISNPQASDWFNVGGVGVPYGTFTKNKNGLTPGETYKGQARTWCDPNGGSYNALSWTAPPIVWTQPTNRIDGGESITNLDLYPNPSRNVFNITFTSEDVQDIRVRVLNVIGEELVVEDLQQFVGEYTKQINLKDNSKGIYLLEIETNEGVINKKLILQ